MATSGLHAGNHKLAAEHYEKAAVQHRAAAESLETGDPVRAGHYAYLAQGHITKAEIYSRAAAQAHAEHHG